MDMSGYHEIFTWLYWIFISVATLSVLAVPVFIWMGNHSSNPYAGVIAGAEITVSLGAAIVCGLLSIVFHYLKH